LNVECDEAMQAGAAGEDWQDIEFLEASFQVAQVLVAQSFHSEHLPG